MQFQFHKGTIRTQMKTNNYSENQDFNSIKVQLEPPAVSSITPELRFQFHKGTIRTLHYMKQ